MGCLMDKDKKVQKKGVKVLARLARTCKHALPSYSVKPLTSCLAAGEQVIMECITEIVRMLPCQGGPPPSHLQLFGPAAVVYDLCKNSMFGTILAWYETNTLLI